jgi:hypothetical protein
MHTHICTLDGGEASNPLQTREKTIPALGYSLHRDMFHFEILLKVMSCENAAFPMHFRGCISPWRDHPLPHACVICPVTAVIYHSQDPLKV